jgi:hypothetical protein
MGVSQNRCARSSLFGALGISTRRGIGELGSAAYGRAALGSVEQRVRPKSQVVGYGYPQYKA